MSNKQYRYYALTKHGKGFGYNSLNEFAHLDIFSWILELELENSFISAHGITYKDFRIKIFNHEHKLGVIKKEKFSVIDIKFTNSTATNPGYWVGLKATIVDCDQEFKDVFIGNYEKEEPYRKSAVVFECPIRALEKLFEFLDELNNFDDWKSYEKNQD